MKNFGKFLSELNRRRFEFRVTSSGLFIAPNMNGEVSSPSRVGYLRTGGKNDTVYMMADEKTDDLVMAAAPIASVIFVTSILLPPLGE